MSGHEVNDFVKETGNVEQPVKAPNVHTVSRLSFSNTGK